MICLNCNSAVFETEYWIGRPISGPINSNHVFCDPECSLIWYKKNINKGKNKDENEEDSKRH